MKRTILSIFILLLLFLPSIIYAADTKFQDLTDISSPALTDDMYIADDPDGTPLDRKINVGALLDVATDLNSSGEVIGGDADTVATITGLAPDTATTQAAQAAITSLGTLTGLTMGGTLDMQANNITITGSIGITGSRVLKGWFTDLEVTNSIIADLTGAVTGAASGNLLNSESDTLVGTLTSDGLTIGQDELLTIGAQTLTHDGTDFIFNDLVKATTAAADDSTTNLATTAYVQGEINGAGGDDLTCGSGVCNVDSPVTSASSVTNATLTTALTVNTGTLTLTPDADNTSVLTIGSGAVGVSGSNTGDNTVATSGDAAVDFFGAGVTSVTDATTFTDIEGRSLSANGAVLDVDVELYSDTKCVIIETPTDADSFIFYHIELGAQVISAHCIVEDATSATIQFQQCDVAGDNCSEITTPLVCDVGGEADDGVIDLPDLDIDDWVRANVTATSGTPGHVTACINIQYDD